MNHSKRQFAASLAAGVLGLGLGPAQAQPPALPGAADTPAQASVARTPEVIVSGRALRDGQRSGTLATGTSGAALDVPFSVDSVDGERVRDQAGTTLQDALRNIPGAQADSGFNGAHTQFFILRGAVSDSGTGSNRVLRDGVRVSNYPYVPAFIDSIDVLRGPGAAVGVRSEPGGTVNLVTRGPQHSGASIAGAAPGRLAPDCTCRAPGSPMRRTGPRCPATGASI